MDTTGMQRKLLGIALAVCAVLAVSVRPAAPFGKNKVNYENFKWLIYHAPHFDIYYYEEEVALLEEMVSYAESAYLHVSKTLDHEVQVRIPLIFYKTHAEFEQTNIILERIPEPVAAFAEPLENRMVMPLDMPPSKLYALVVHELTHIFEYSILFEGQLRRSFRARPPLWLMEGLAEHMAARTDSLDAMVIRDAVVNGIIPPITQVNSLSFLTYRFGEAAFDFIEQEYGSEGIRNFLFEYRKVLLTNNLGKAIKETFGIEPQEFDRLFERYLQRKYLPTLLAKNEPQDYGRQIGYLKPGIFTFSPTLSPTGELIAALTNKKEEVDLVVLSAQDGKVLKNLTKGFSRHYEYILANIFSGHNDLTWSPTGDNIAFFVRKENKRVLMIKNALNGRTKLRQPLPIDKASSPAFSPDGTEILFAASQGGVADIFRYNLETEELINVTDDDFFDANPRWSEDGKSAIYNRRINDYFKIFLVDLEDPTLKTQLTFGEHSDIQPSYSRDGTEIYFASDADQDDIFNIYSLDLQTGAISRWTDVMGGLFTPLEMDSQGGVRTVTVTGYDQGMFRLYRLNLEEPVAVIRPEDEEYEPVEIVKFEPALQLTLDDGQKSSYKKLKWHFEGRPDVGFGITDDGTILTNAQLAWVDLLGDHRITGIFYSVSTFSNFDFIYTNMKRRWDWFVEALDLRDFFTVGGLEGGDRVQKFRSITGAQGGFIFPFNTYYRISSSLGVFQRDLEVPLTVDVTGDGVGDIVVFEQTKGTFPIWTTVLTGDTVKFKQYVGPWDGMRYDFTIAWAPVSTGELEGWVNYVLDWRWYQKITRNSLFAVRFYGAVSNGRTNTEGQSSSDVFSVGGYNEIRGYNFREFFGNRASFANLELRFPLLDAIVVHGNFGLAGIQGVFFFDVGGAWFRGDQVWDPNLLVFNPTDGFFTTGGLRPFDFYGTTEIFKGKFDSAGEPRFGNYTGLIDGRSSYGFGFNFQFGGFLLNWTFSQRLPFLETEANTRADGSLIIDPGGQPRFRFIEVDSRGFRSSFYIGTRF